MNNTRKWSCIAPGVHQSSDGFRIERRFDGLWTTWTVCWPGNFTATAVASSLAEARRIVTDHA